MSQHDNATGELQIVVQHVGGVLMSFVISD